MFVPGSLWSSGRKIQGSFQSKLLLCWFVVCQCNSEGLHEWWSSLDFAGAVSSTWENKRFSIKKFTPHMFYIYPLYAKQWQQLWVNRTTWLSVCMPFGLELYRLRASQNHQNIFVSPPLSITCHVPAKHNPSSMRNESLCATTQPILTCNRYCNDNLSQPCSQTLYWVNIRWKIVASLSCTFCGASKHANTKSSSTSWVLQTKESV